MFDLRPVALEDMVRGTVNVRRARVWKLGHIFAVVVRTQARNRCTSCLMLTKQAGVWLNSRHPLAQHQILPLSLAS